MESPPFDVIIVGAGAAGCALAGRLSEVRGKRVLLIEAGADAPAGQEHPDIRDPFPVAYCNPAFCWPGLMAETGAEPRDGQRRTSLPYVQGYGVGGGSNVNGMAADRGLPQDYDEWSHFGISGWAWKDVLPWFTKIEHDADFSGALHGDSGPMPVRRVAPNDWAPFSKAVASALKRRGFPLIEDFNADFRDGISSVPMNCLPDRRVSASMAYLPSSVRRRANLSIVPNALAELLDIAGGRVRGIVARTASGERRYEAPLVLVACGAIQSPALLMRSGLGPASELRAQGIDVVRDLPGVGRNLQNHPMVMLVHHLPRVAMQARAQRPWQQNQLRYSSGIAGCPEHDMLIIPFNKVAWHPLGRRVGALLINVLKPHSTGTVELTSPQATVPPRVRFNLLSDGRDFERLVTGLRFALDLLMDAEVRRTRNEVFLPNGRLVARLALRSPLSWMEAWLLARLFDASPLRRKLFWKATLDVPALARDEGALREFVRATAQAVYHVCGTCRMGRAEDPQAVLDSACRVKGIEGLRVVDASIFPSIPSANTHFPVLMAAEKIASAIKSEW